MEYLLCARFCAKVFYMHFNTTTLQGWYHVAIPVLQMWKLRHRVVKYLAHYHTATTLAPVLLITLGTMSTIYFYTALH